MYLNYDKKDYYTNNYTKPKNSISFSNLYIND